MPNNSGTMKHAALIEALGGTFAVAHLTEVKAPSVSEWKRNNRIPDDKLRRLAVVAEDRGIATRQSFFPKTAHLFWPDLPAPTPEASNAQA